MNTTAMRAILAGVLALGLAGCADQMDLGRFGGRDGPRPDARGVITYPTYQVAVAQPGDTVRLIAQRLGQDPDAMGKLNGIHPDTALRTGEIVVLPARIESYYGPDGLPNGSSGGADIGSNVGVAPSGTAGPVRRPGSVDVAAIAGDAINRAEAGQGQGQTQGNPAANEPQRHVVQNGETAEGIAARYGVSLQALLQLNGLHQDSPLRLGQILLIPTQVTAAPPRTRPAPVVSPPGQQTPVPPPPSAAPPAAATKPAATKPAATKPAEPPAAKPSDTKGQFTMPVKGSIIRDFQKGKSDGIDISARAGSPVVAAGDGTVAAITRDTKGVPILVIRHSNGLLTVYAGIDNLTVARGDTVKRGQKVAVVRKGSPAFLHFEVRKGIDSIDPMNFL